MIEKKKNRNKKRGDKINGLIVCLNPIALVNILFLIRYKIF